MPEKPPRTKTPIEETIAQVEEENEVMFPPAEGVPTRAESQAALIEAVNKFPKAEVSTETATPKVEKPESVFDTERMKEYMSQRNGALDQKAEKLGIGGFVRSIGEKYNKINWKYKLLAGIGLGVTTAVTAFPAAITACAVGLIAAQRALGATGMFVKFEKNLKDIDKGEAEGFFKGRLLGKEGWYQKAIKNMELSEEGQRNMAIGMTLAYTVGMSAAIGGAVEYARDHGWVEWISNHLPSMDAHAAGTSAAPATAPAPEAATPAPEAAVSAPEVKVEMPSVAASARHGYEYMMKRMWEDLHDPAKHFVAPKDINPDSDLAKLLAAKPEEIDGLVHRIAADSHHHFFHANGENVLIDPKAHMTFGDHGELHLATEKYDYTFAPDHAPTTPAYHPHVAAAPAPENVQSVVFTHETPPPTTYEEAYNNAIDNAPHLPHVSAEQVQGSASAYDPKAPDAWMHINDPGKGMDPFRVEDYPANHVPGAGAHPVEVAHAPTPHLSEHIAVNGSGVEINISEPHIYASHAAGSVAPVPGQGIDVMNMPTAQPERLFVYGGDPAGRAETIAQYLSQHHDKIVYAADSNNEHRIPWHWADGKVVPGTPVRTSGFLGFFASFMKAPTPDELGKLIK